MDRQLSVVLLLAVVMAISGCGSSAAPTSPSAPPTAAGSPAPVPQPAPKPTYTLSGIVSESTPTGQAPVEGVQLYCDSCGSPEGHTFTSTDANGFYSFSWTQDGVHSLLVWKDGYELLDRTGGLATVHGDTRLDILVVRR